MRIPDCRVSQIAKTIGPNDPTNPGDEAELDVQYISECPPFV